MLILVKMRFPSSLYQIYISPNLLSISQTVRKLCSTEKSDFYGSLTFLSSAVNSLIPFLTLRASQKSGLYTPMLISSNYALILQALVQCVSNCLTCSLWQYSQIKVMVQQYKHLPLSRSNILSSLFILCNYSEVQPYICSLLFIVNTRPQSSSILILVAFQRQFDVRQFLSMALHLKGLDCINLSYSMQLFVCSSILINILSLVDFMESINMVSLASNAPIFKQKTTNSMLRHGSNGLWLPKPIVVLFIGLSTRYLFNVFIIN